MYKTDNIWWRQWYTDLKSAAELYGRMVTHTHTHAYACTHNTQWMQTKEDILKTGSKKINAYYFQKGKTMAEFSKKTI